MPPGMAKLCAARPTEANGSSSMTGTRVSEIVSVMNASLIPKRPTPAATRRRCSLLRMLLSLRECRSNRRGEGLRRSSGLRYGWMCQPETRWVNLVSLRSRGVMTAWWGPMSASIELSVGLSVSLLQEWTENGGWYSSSRDCKCGCIVYFRRNSMQKPRLSGLGAGEHGGVYLLPRTAIWVGWRAGAFSAQGHILQHSRCRCAYPTTCRVVIEAAGIEGRLWTPQLGSLHGSEKSRRRRSSERTMDHEMRDKTQRDSRPARRGIACLLSGKVPKSGEGLDEERKEPEYNPYSLERSEGTWFR